MGKGARSRRVRAEQVAAGKGRQRESGPDRQAQARDVMDLIAQERFTTPPWEAYRKVERRLADQPQRQKDALAIISLVPFGVREFEHGNGPSGSGSLGMLADQAGLPVPELVACLEDTVKLGCVTWAQASHTLVMNVPTPA